MEEQTVARREMRALSCTTMLVAEKEAPRGEAKEEAGLEESPGDSNESVAQDTSAGTMPQRSEPSTAVPQAAIAQNRATSAGIVDTIGEIRAKYPD